MHYKNSDVEKIRNFLIAKINALKESLANYETPMMQDMSKDSQHLQLEYIRTKAQLQAYEDALLAIDNFVPMPAKDAATTEAKEAGASKVKPQPKRNGKAGKRINPVE